MWARKIYISYFTPAHTAPFAQSDYFPVEKKGCLSASCTGGLFEGSRVNIFSNKSPSNETRRRSSAPAYIHQRKWWFRKRWNAIFTKCAVNLTWKQQPLPPLPSTPSHPTHHSAISFVTALPPYLPTSANAIQRHHHTTMIGYSVQ